MFNRGKTYQKYTQRQTLKRRHDIILCQGFLEIMQMQLCNMSFTVNKIKKKWDKVLLGYTPIFVYSCVCQQQISLVLAFACNSSSICIVGPGVYYLLCTLLARASASKQRARRFDGLRSSTDSFSIRIHGHLAIIWHFKYYLI